jgi:hypothetical protein
MRRGGTAKKDDRQVLVLSRWIEPRGPDGTSGTLNLRTFGPSDRRTDEEMIVRS